MSFADWAVGSAQWLQLNTVQIYGESTENRLNNLVINYKL